MNGEVVQPDLDLFVAVVIQLHQCSASRTARGWQKVAAVSLQEQGTLWRSHYRYKNVVS
jgi:hypothetical protein